MQEAEIANVSNRSTDSGYTLIHRSGNIDLCPDSKFMLVDNIETGFDLYRFDRTSVIRSFGTKVVRYFVKEVAFAESATLAIGGSDSGEVHIFNAATGEKIQSLQHGQKDVLVQTVKVRGVVVNTNVLRDLMVKASSYGHKNVIASSGSDGKVCVWERTVGSILYRPTNVSDKRHVAIQGNDNQTRQ